MTLSGVVTSAAEAAPPCSKQTPVKSSCEIALSALHPTQTAVGKITVEERAVRMSANMDFVKYTAKRPIPVVQAPDGGFYLTDSHHLASVLSRLGAGKVTAEVIGRFSEPRTFWQEMEKRHWVWLFDPKGNPIKPAALPRRITDLQDDPYRALASYAQDAGYFKKTDAYFMEFHWARYFGQRMNWQSIDRMNLLAAIRQAELFACQPEARNLPGYAGPCKANSQ
ncbi:chromosome partitioning protein ParB [Noviherbaspirillum saxi]|uniref:Chromosome partitioning protein ParB n=1 Tax=Noviherbaspirillum saxi TaxID=2320863 RepID=A0A3A3FT72_9BURK|nr:chromosome partitioning protein ParB [Noviherbaspirillum saxi]